MNVYELYWLYDQLEPEVNKVKMNNDYKFDVDLSQLKVEIDNKDVHHLDEIPSINLLNKILSGKIEMKNHDTATQYGNLFIEFIIRKNNKFEFSGLSTTKADFWLFTIKDMAYFYPTEFLRYLKKNRKYLGLEVKNNDYELNYIGYGLIVPIAMIIDLYNKWTKHKQEISLKEIRKTLFNK